MSQRHNFSCPLESRTNKRLLLNPETNRCILATGSTAQRLRDEGVALQPWKRNGSQSRKSTARGSSTARKASKSPAAPKARESKARKPKATGLKRPPSAFLMFMMDHREAIKRRFPNISFGDIAVEASNQWKSASKSVKDRYLALYDQAREDYLRQVERGPKAERKPKASTTGRPRGRPRGSKNIQYEENPIFGASRSMKHPPRLEVGSEYDSGSDDEYFSPAAPRNRMATMGSVSLPPPPPSASFHKSMSGSIPPPPPEEDWSDEGVGSESDSEYRPVNVKRMAQSINRRSPKLAYIPQY